MLWKRFFTFQLPFSPRVRAMLVVALIFVLCGFSAFFAYREHNSYQASTYLSTVSRSLSDSYYFSDSTELLQAVEEGLQTSDKYFQLYFTDTDFHAAFSALNETVSKFYGIRYSSKTGVISSVLKHSTAYGLLFADDVLLSVNDITDSELFYEALHSAETADLLIRRGDLELPITVKSGTLNAAYAHLEADGTANLTLYFFSKAELMILYDFLMAHHDQITSLTIDLTQCPGGRVASLTSTLSLFLPKNTKLFIEQRRTGSNLYQTPRSPILDLQNLKIPVQILKSEKTASSAEIFAGVLKYHLPDLVTLEGAQTYGKWTTVQPVKFLKGGMLMTVGKVFLPDGSTYEGIGL
jgi:C-terminal processing protease CtpA/Prc